MPSIHAHPQSPPERSANYRDMAVETLGDECAELLERVALLEADVASYRELAHEAIAALHVAVTDRDRIRGENRRLREALRELVGVAHEYVAVRQRRAA